jgi:hypothetical protein
LRAPGEKSKFEKFIGYFKWYLALAGLITFSMFILEESLQTTTFGIWPAKNAKAWANVKRGLDLMDNINTTLKVINYSVGWFQPLAFISYRAYSEASDSFIEGSIAEVLANEPDLYVNCKVRVELVVKKIESLQDGTWLAIGGRVAAKVKSQPELGETLHVEGTLKKRNEKLVIE